MNAERPEPTPTPHLQALEWDTSDLPPPKAAGVNAAMAAEVAGVGRLEGRFEGKAAFDNQVLHFLQRAVDEGWPELIVGDPDFGDWPWGSALAVDMLHRWARQGRQMTILASQFDVLVRRHPRWVAWRRVWDHKLQCRKYLSREPSSVPSMLWSPQWVVHRLDAERCVGIATSDRMAVVQHSEVLQEWILRKSTPAFPSSVLGL